MSEKEGNERTVYEGRVKTGDENQDIKRLLKRTWYIFFSRSAPLSPVRKMVIRTVFEGKNAVIAAPEKEGISEAVLAPLCETVLEEKRKGLAVLYLTPTRARANEIFGRLREQLARPGLRVSKKTAYRVFINADNPPDFLITTPEALDSLLCRYPEGLERVRAVVLDGVHGIDGGYRGDQVRLLLERLREIAGKFSVYALSTPVGNAVQVGERYMDDFQVIRVEEEREIKETYAASFEEIFELAGKEYIKKILVFCGSREKSEEVETLLKKFRDPLTAAAHLAVLHEGLSGSEKEEVENFFKNAERAVCISSVAHDAGISVGDIDAVVFAGIPGNLHSFARGFECAGKTTGFARVFFLCDSKSMPLFELLLDHAKENFPGNKVYVPELSVAVQQIFSVLFSNPWGVDEDYLYRLFNNFCAYEDLKSIIEELLASGLISSRNRKIYASEFIMNQGEEGTLHSNIPLERFVEVVNSRTNKKIGEARLSPGCIRACQSFSLAGKSWEIFKLEEESVYVKKSTVKGVFNSLKCAAGLGAFFEYLPEKIQEAEIEKRKGV
ncbi:MAG: DEAD/DEAH box helicase [Methanosarcinaceae archaeon]